MRHKVYTCYKDIEDEFKIDKETEETLLCLLKYFGEVIIETDGAILSNTKGHNVLGFITPKNLNEKTRTRHKFKGQKVAKWRYKQETEGDK
ncbi:hypothetical protein CUN38_04915 [Enterococcus faecium]|uniref:hypothetical protein n=1 Tax=Enterococcus faecium TaxID=1352 RepID=UPI000CF04108|nr:hypothetical protein [Enterococcus faecium]PQC93485.1 hypothetical protein CUN38_04915 [Enterococcus faecium]